MDDEARAVISPSAAALELSQVLVDQAVALDARGLVAADAMTEIRKAARLLAEALHERGWGPIFTDLDPWEDGDEEDFPNGETDDDESLPGTEDEPDPLPPGEHLTYQARHDFIVVDPQLLIESAITHARERGQIVDETDEEIGYPGGALFYLTYHLDFSTGRDLAAIGLKFAGGEGRVAPIEKSLWETGYEEQGDSFPLG